MFKCLRLALNSAANSQGLLLTTENFAKHQLRTTFVLKRRNPVPLNKKGREPKALKSKHYVYDVVQMTHVERQPNIDIILKSYVEGIGNAGNRVSVKPNFAYNNILLPGLGVYASPENLEKYKNHEVEEERHSSPNAPITAKIMARMLLSVVMNMETPWTLKPWHVKASFRKCGYIVPEDTITLPEKPIKGPDMNLQDKEFFVTVTINNQEKVNVRCRIHHWNTDLVKRIPYTPNFWEQPAEAIFSEQAAILENLPKKPTVKKSLPNV
ncbi:39S ribosomal protein L9, mitochondrial [Anoplophora glabripennis]|uniref:39S ribosomal protein L9, mitochondrial n=1 Tax=Anoplophora glabripennis TaxID=217634 RepID=UPI000874B1C1|nr:39S ribosomal protein L9, mitochondrial [Anoplophora glabripennis]